MKVLIRTTSAGVHYGTLVYRAGREVKLEKSRRIWKWAGANTLSELATFGPQDVSGCQFACAVTITLTEATEIIECSEKASKSIEAVPAWK